jgi:hypothetical protein
VAIAETMPRQEGNQMHVILSQRTGRKSSKPKAAEAVRSGDPTPVEE